MTEQPVPPVASEDKNFFQKVLQFITAKPKRAIIIGIILLVFMCMCVALVSPSSDTPASEAVDPTAIMLTAQSGIFQTMTAEAPAATETPESTATSEPTATTQPTATPPPQPIRFEGVGDDVLMIDWDGPGLMQIQHTGGGNFILQQYDAAQNFINLPVNTIGNYTGLVPFDFRDDENTAIIEVTAGGSWSIEITPINQTYMPSAAPGETYQGAGDDVLLIGGAPSSAEYVCNQSGNFIVWNYTTSGGVDLSVNEIAPYTGKVLVPRNTFIMQVTAPGAWTMILE